MKWLVINVGCLECGIPTNVIGLRDSEEEALGLAAANNYGDGRPTRVRDEDRTDTTIRYGNLRGQADIQVHEVDL